MRIKKTAFIDAEVTLVVNFAWEEEDWDLPEDMEEYAKEAFLEWLGTVSDNFILDGVTVQIERREA